VLKPGGSTYDLLEAFDQIITVEGVRETIEQKVSCSIETVNPGVDTDHFIPSDTETGNKRVLFVGRFVPAKNLSLLIEAFDAVIDYHPEAELVLVGDGPKRNQLENEVQRRELTDQVQFPGYVPNKELPKWYQSASVFALSSRHESYGITLLEAMSSGIPVVAPRIGSIPAIVEDGRTGLLYTAGSATELYTALDNFLSNPKSQTVCGQNAREKASNEFDWSERQTELFELYDSLINSQETTT
jgi:glycosyltransferase involved in cell wall biosynthesis